MPAIPAEVQARLAFSRAFLVFLDRGDVETATLFARAFVAQGSVVNGLRVRASDG